MKGATNAVRFERSRDTSAPPPLDYARGERKSGTVRIAGYAALFDIPDGAKDTIVAGAFAKTLAEREEPLPLYWQHHPEQRIGTVDLVEEDAKGLRVVATIDNPQSRAISSLLDRSVNGLSFGYRARGYRSTPQGRVLEDIDLFEVSLVSHPLQHGARVHLIT